jgi:type I restriction enzyme S subunit
MDAAEYKHVVLGLVFLKYISDAFEELHASSKPSRPRDRAPTRRTPTSTAPRTSSGCRRRRAGRSCRATPSSHHRQAGRRRDGRPRARQPVAQGRAAQGLRRPGLDKTRLGELIDLIGTSASATQGRSARTCSAASTSTSSPVRRAEGKNGGQFYTPRSAWCACWSRCSRPTRGASTTPAAARAACSSVEREVRRGPRRARRRHQHLRPGVEPHDVAPGEAEPRHPRHRRQHRAHGDTFHNDGHKDLKADYVLANPPFNDSDWGGEPARRRALEVRRAARGQRQLRLGAALPPPPRAHRHRRLRAGQRQHVVAAVGRGRDPQGHRRGRPRRLHGRAAGAALLLDADPRLPVVSGARQEERPRRSRQEDAQPPEGDALHRRAQARHARRPRAPRALRRRHREDRRHVPRWRGDGAGKYEDVAGFCKSATTDEIASHQFVLTPGRYVGAEEVEDDGEPFDEKMPIHNCRWSARCLSLSKAAAPTGRSLAMAGEWKEVTIGDLAPFAYGKGLPEARRSANGNIPVYGSNGVVGLHDTPLTAGPTIVIGRKGTVGAVHYSPVPCWPIDTTFFVTDSDPVLVRYHYYVLRSTGLEHMNADSAVPGLNRDAAHARRVRIPICENEQHAIAQILGTLDDKIELNRRMSEDAGGHGPRACSKSWFVDYDPVRAKMEGRDTGLPPALAALFPDRLVDSELGEIPEGWEVASLGNLLELAYGKALKAEDRRGGSIPVYGSNGQVGWHNERLVTGPGIVVGRKGNPGVVAWAATDFFVIDTAFYVVSKMRARSLHFLFHALRTHNLASLSADSAVPGLNRNLAYMSMQTLPGQAVLDQFEKIGRSLAEQVHVLEEESRTLAALRDTLLPKLISGELRVDDAERILGRIDR